MGKQVYISADYDETNGDRAVVDVLHGWSEDDKHLVDYVDTAQVVSGSVSEDPDCRICDLKREFNAQINASSAVVFIIGDKTKDRAAGCACKRQDHEWCFCTPYKQNANGRTVCKISGALRTPTSNEDVGSINTYSYLEHEFRQAVKKKKNIIIVYNSLYKQSDWLPSYMEDYEDTARPFWIKNSYGEKEGDYSFIKQALGYDE